MEKIEVQEIIEACEEAESDYIKLFRPLLGYDDEVELYRGVNDSLISTLEEIEGKIGIETPGDLLQLYLIANGGKYFGVNLYYLSADKNDTKGLYYSNMNDEFRKKYKIPEGFLVVGETSFNELILVGIDAEGYYKYCIWDKNTLEENNSFDLILELLINEINYNTGAFEEEYSKIEENE